VLKAGNDVTLADGRVIHASDVLLPAVTPRRVVFMGDNHHMPEAFVEPFTACADGCSLLVDECTFPQELMEKCDKYKKHSSPSIVAKLASSVHANTVAITHFSQRVTHDAAEEGSTTPEHLVEQVQSFLTVKDMKVVAAEDYLEVVVPKMA